MSRKRGGRPQVYAYEWRTANGDRIPGAVVKVPGAASRWVWVDRKDLVHVADQLIDVLEAMEGRTGPAPDMRAGGPL